MGTCSKNNQIPVDFLKQFPDNAITPPHHGAVKAGESGETPRQQSNGTADLSSLQATQTNAAPKYPDKESAMWFDSNKNDEYLGFSDKSQVGDVVWYFFLASLAGLILSSLLGCAPFQPRVVDSVIDGVRVVQHIDTTDAPRECGDRTEWAGCHQDINGVSHIWHASTAPQHIINHELGHSKGMRHTGWSKDFTGRQCAVVWASGGKYKSGQMICLTDRGEDVYADVNFTVAIRGE